MFWMGTRSSHPNTGESNSKRSLSRPVDPNRTLWILRTPKHEGTQVSEVQERATQANRIRARRRAMFWDGCGGFGPQSMDAGYI